MRTLINNMFAGDEKLDLYIGVIETIEGIISKQPKDAWRKIMNGDIELVDTIRDSVFEAGLMGLGIPEEYGGMGSGLLGPVIQTDLLARHGINTFSLLLTHFSRKTVLKFGTKAQIEKYVVPTITGDKSFCICATEPNPGINTFNTTTKAVRKGDKWILNGQKTFITRAKEADYGLLISKTDLDKPNDLSIFVLDMKAPGIRMQKLNINTYAGDDQYTLFFDDVELDADALVGLEGDGARYMFEGLNAERLILSALSVGFSDKALSVTADYVNQRVVFGGRPTGSYQGVQHPLAQYKADTEAARLMTYYGAKLFDQGIDAGFESNIAKLLSSTAANKMADAAIQFHGGSGMDEDVGVIGLWKVTRPGRIAPINNEMILNDIAEHEIDLPKSH
jgi:acyl-CoA dehydrogenase